MDGIFPRLSKTSSNKVGQLLVKEITAGWVLSLQLIALIVLAIAPIWATRALQEWGNISRGQTPAPIIIQLTPSLGFALNRMATNTISIYLVAWVYLGCSLWIYHIRQEKLYSRPLAVSLATGSISLAAAVGAEIYSQLNLLGLASTILAAGTLIQFAFQFPFTPASPSRRYRGWNALLSTLTLLGLSLLVWFSRAFIFQNSLIRLATLLILSATLVTFLIVSLTKYRIATQNSEKAQIRAVTIGALASFTPILVWAGLDLQSYNLPLSPLYILPLAIFPIYSSFSLTHYTQFNRSRFLSQTITYALLSGFVVISYVFLVTITSLAISGVNPGANPVLIGFTIFVLAVSINPLRDRLQQQVDRLFFRSKQNYRESLQVFARDLAQVDTLEAIVAFLHNFISKIFSPRIIHIFLYNPHLNQYYAAPVSDGRPTSDMMFPSNSTLVHMLAENNQPIYLRDRRMTANLKIGDSARAALLGAVLLSPFPGQRQLAGWLALGERISGEPYTNADLAYIDALCRQAALAIERAQGIINLEQRIRELDVLTRIAQGVNITLEFDDILELIYAQTINIIPASDFRVTLRSPNENRCYHAICVEADERIAYNENINIPPDQGLEQIVILNQRAYLTDDYIKECHAQGVIPDAEGIIAWVGVPLNAGGETIGAISLGSRDPNLIFSQNHLAILQAIADQAAGAIVKTQLLAEAEKRTLQLNKLNAVARNLSSTLEINPLLNQIMNSAVEILNCEAGSLIMVDEHTGELVFEVTVGPVASDLTGVRLPAGTGVAGKVIQNGEPMIVNNAAQNQDWFAESDKETGFFTRDLLAIPMRVKNNIIGVIEVINKLDGSSFSKDDLEFLSAFTSQAAIAIENARLYTQTDQALSARLEEMSVLQRIDRELNTSLDVERAMSITLDWSVNQTGADAGLIGFVEQKEMDGSKSLRVVSAKGFQIRSTHGIDNSSNTNQRQPENLDWEFNQPVINLTSVQQAIREGKPIRNEFYLQPEILEEASSANSAGVFQPEAKLLPLAKSQVVVPIRRKTDVIALLLLESTRSDSFSDEKVTFLSRLSDHAAIAISNAQLYADLQAANIAKSEFVSLVSHELKTPMTSIRGYTDLLAQGTVGPINEIQSNFLNTIRSNVNRMATLVSDLTDISRIEAGRLRLEFGSISISTIVEDVVKSARAQLNEKEHEISLAIPDDLPKVWGDYNRLIQIMNNLVSNAIKYTPEHGQITISAEHTSNIWDASGAPKVVHLWVSDTGYGISAEDQEKIFQKFFRSSDPNIRDLPGTGLGLSITRHLIEMQGGRIWFESTLNKGTTFHITIPVSATN